MLFLFLFYFILLLWCTLYFLGVGVYSSLGGYSNKYGIYKKSCTDKFYAFLVVFNDLSLNGFKINYDFDKILKSDWLSATLISSLL